ncbi:MAG: hypothetical protein MAG458_01720 [Nitrosopumilus sp.]|nr:hypothetical protein [Nitrosopumilus sp.]
MLYQDYETEISQQYLADVFSEMQEPVCLLGGWAVFLTVNERFNNATGQYYLGSRDIDLGFHVDSNWSDEELKNSALAKSVKILTDRKFIGLGSRFVKHYDINTKEELSEEESKRKQSYEMFQLYVDPMSDNVHKDAQKIVSFPLLDEPLLSHVFNDDKFVTMSEFGGSFKLPNPEVLIATKLKSVTCRTKDDKRVKDVSDIYALLWHSETEFDELKKEIWKILDQKTIEKTVNSLTDNDFDAASTANEIPKDQISRIINELAKS